MKRGDIYLVKRGDPRDPKKQRPFVIVSRSSLMDSAFPTVVCAPVTSKLAQGLATQVNVGELSGLKHDSAILCDALVSIPKSALTDYRGHLSADEVIELDDALAIALDL